MERKSYSSTIVVQQSPKEVFNCIKDVSKWWNKECKGRSEKLNDEFIISHGDVHYSKQKLIEIIPNRRIVWQITDSELAWLERDKAEWTNTKLVFEIALTADKTIVQFTHEGLVPAKECYERVARSWDMVIREWLFSFITSGKAI
ncbi:MAG: SRPBCC domain-containing protein [Bacteroidota bacterium]|nr:SRPBCC domain-containing protein [Bacteroidota bacterium]